METVKNRRSIRKYAGKPVDEELLRRLLEVSERTQTMGNMQLYSVVVTRSEEVKKRLAPAHFNQPMVTQAPVILTICADFNRTVKWAEQRKAQPGYDNFLSFLNAATDALLFTQTFCNLAEAEGLGICYLGTTLYMPSQIIDILQLPRLVMPVATLTVGWLMNIPSRPTVCLWRLWYMKRPIATILPKLSTDITGRKNNYQRTGILWKSTTRRRWLKSSRISVTPVRITKL